MPSEFILEDLDIAVEDAEVEVVGNIGDEYDGVPRTRYVLPQVFHAV